MGCSSSTLNDEKEKASAPEANIVYGPVCGQPIIPTVAWEPVESWEAFREKTATALGANGDEDSQFQVARSWLAHMYPECHRYGRIETLATQSITGPCPFPHQSFFVLDIGFGIPLSLFMVVAAPPAEEGESQFKVGAMLDSPEMEMVKIVLLKMAAWMEQRIGLFEHAEIHIIIGADMVRCKFKPGYQKPTMTLVCEENYAKKAAQMDDLAKRARRNPFARWALAGKFNPTFFRNIVRGLQVKNPGCIVWDGGDFPFSVGDMPCLLPTRLLVLRQIENTAEENAAIPYTVKTPLIGLEDDQVTFVRGPRPENAFDGAVVRVSLLVAIPPDVVWPKSGDYANKPIIKSATIALLAHLTKLNEVGKLQRCIVGVAMGTDHLTYSFVGDKVEPAVSEIKNPLVTETIRTDPITSSNTFKSLDDFSVTVVPELHKFWESEGHFQAIKETVNESARQNPEPMHELTSSNRND